MSNLKNSLSLYATTTKKIKRLSPDSPLSHSTKSNFGEKTSQLRTINQSLSSSYTHWTEMDKLLFFIYFFRIFSQKLI